MQSSAKKALVFGVLGAVILAAGIAVRAIRNGDIRQRLAPPPKAPSSGIELAPDERSLIAPETGARVTIPDGWRAEPVTAPERFLLRLAESAAECTITVTHGKNTWSESARALLQRYDLGPRFGSRISDTEQKLVDVSGWSAAYFSWNEGTSVRRREVYVPYGAFLFSFSYSEDLTEVGLQPKPCVWDFDWLLAQGINLPK